MTETYSGVATFYGGRREKSQWVHLRTFKNNNHVLNFLLLGSAA
jgi:hypothetical protein